MKMTNKNQDQIDRFKETAREIGADESDDALDRVMGKLDLKRRQQDPKKRDKQTPDQ